MVFGLKGKRSRSQSAKHSEGERASGRRDRANFAGGSPGPILRTAKSVKSSKY